MLINTSSVGPSLTVKLKTNISHAKRRNYIASQQNLRLACPALWPRARGSMGTPSPPRNGPGHIERQKRLWSGKSGVKFRCYREITYLVKFWCTEFIFWCDIKAVNPYMEYVLLMTWRNTVHVTNTTLKNCHEYGGMALPPGSALSDNMCKTKTLHIDKSLAEFVSSIHRAGWYFHFVIQSANTNTIKTISLKASSESNSCACCTIDH